MRYERIARDEARRDLLSVLESRQRCEIVTAESVAALTAVKPIAYARESCTASPDV